MTSRIAEIEARLKAGKVPVDWGQRELERALLDSVYRRLDLGYASPFDGYTLPLATLLAAAPSDLAYLLQALADERERCAKVAEELFSHWPSCATRAGAEDAAKAIRSLPVKVGGGV